MRAHGPYKHGRRYRVITVAADGDRGRRTFESEGEALEYLATFDTRAHGVGVADAVKRYLEHAATIRKASTVTTLGYRLASLLRTKERERPIATLTPATAGRLLARRRGEASKRTSKLPSVDTLVGELAAAQGFGAWCVEQGLLRRDPFAELHVAGARARGKAQLRIDEARRFVDTALGEGSLEGLAAAMALLMGLRASELVDRQVRDVDDGGRVLWIERAKTRKGDRHLEVPEALRGPLVDLCEGRAATDRLFGEVDRHWLGYHVRRLCLAAKVPEVGPQALRGTQSSIAATAVSVEHVAAALGHTGPTVTRRHYLARGAEQRGKQRAALRVLQGGKTR